MSAAELYIDSDLTVKFDETHLASAAFDGTTEYTTSGFAGTASIKDSAGLTITSTTTWTFVGGSDGVWYATLGAQSLTEGAEYTVEIDVTSPVDDYRLIKCVAAYRT